MEEELVVKCRRALRSRNVTGGVRELFEEIVEHGGMPRHPVYPGGPLAMSAGTLERWKEAEQYLQSLGRLFPLYVVHRPGV